MRDVVGKLGVAAMRAGLAAAALRNVRVWRLVLGHDLDRNWAGQLPPAADMTRPTTEVAGSSVPRRADVGAAVRVSALSKTFDLPHERYTSAKQRVLHPFSFRTHEVLQALQDVSSRSSGESFGIIGRNGSGKSTLSVVSRDLRLDSGRWRSGPGLRRSSSSGSGSTPSWPLGTTRQNAVLVGLSRREARARRRDVAFAELERFADQKLKNYSNGWRSRLAFAVAITSMRTCSCSTRCSPSATPRFRRSVDHFERLRAGQDDRARHARHGGARAVVQPESSASTRIRRRGGRGPEDRRSVRGQKPGSRSGDDALGASRRADRGAGDTDLEQACPRRLGAPQGAARAQPTAAATITTMLATTDLRLKYLDTVFSYAWALLRPALLFAVLLLVFGGLANFDDGVPHYAGQLVIGVVLWTSSSRRRTPLCTRSRSERTSFASSRCRASRSRSPPCSRAASTSSSISPSRSASSSPSGPCRGPSGSR